MRDYESKHRDKISGGYIELEIKYTEDDEEKPKPKKTKSDKGKSEKKDESKLSKEVQDLMKLIFDMNMINQSMQEIGYDAKKCPLGKLGDSTIK